MPTFPDAIAAPRRAIVTIVTNDYFFWCRALFETVQAVYHGQRACLVYVIGDLPSGISADSLGFEAVRVEHLGLDAFDDMAFRYTPFELTNALKPQIIRHTLESLQFEEVVYLDADVIVVSRLDEVDRALSDGASFIATSHVTAPHQGEFHPTNLSILRVGRLNAGFLAIRRDPETLGFLSWWSRTLETESKIALEQGYFVDQSWLQYAPSFLSGFLELKHRGYNVGHWNLAQNPVELTAEGYRAGGQPLRFFHRSGTDPATPDLISRYEPRLPRRDFPAIDRLLCEHDRILSRVSRLGETDLRALTYTFGVLSDGRKIPLSWRRAYALRYPEGRPADVRSPFEPGTHPCNTPARAVPLNDGVGISELLVEVWRASPLLQQVFDINELNGQMGLCGWLEEAECSGRLRTLGFHFSLQFDQIQALRGQFANAVAEHAAHTLKSAQETERSTREAAARSAADKQEYERLKTSLRWLLRSTAEEIWRRVRTGARH